MKFLIKRLFKFIKKKSGFKGKEFKSFLMKNFFNEIDDKFFDEFFIYNEKTSSIRIRKTNNCLLSIFTKNESFQDYFRDF